MKNLSLCDFHIGAESPPGTSKERVFKRLLSSGKAIGGYEQKQDGGQAKISERRLIDQ